MTNEYSSLITLAGHVFVYHVCFLHHFYRIFSARVVLLVAEIDLSEQHDIHTFHSEMTVDCSNQVNMVYSDLIHLVTVSTSISVQ